MSKEKELSAIQKAYATMGSKDQEILNEGVNDNEAVHQKLLKKLHKELPELGLNKAEHISKHRGFDNTEYHTYSANIPIHDSVKHLFKSLKAEVTFSHNSDKSVEVEHHGHVDYKYEHPSGGTNGHTVGHIMQTRNGDVHLRSTATGITKKL